MSLIINALAGTGKTFTLVGGIHCLLHKHLPAIPSKQQAMIWNELSANLRPETVCFAAFNVSVKEEMERRLRGIMHCDVTTMHGMGLRTIRREVGISGQTIQVDKYKTDRLIETVHNGASIYVLRKTKPGYPAAVKRLVELSKFMAEKRPDDEILISLAGQYNVTLGDNSNMIFDTTRKVLELAMKDCKRIDFNDMPWLPIVLDMPIRKYDMLFVDEGQDLNCCQQQLVLRASEEIMLAGDKHQAIYGFTGADTESMNTMYNELLHISKGIEMSVCKTFPLTISRRCSKAVVAEAQHIVPEFEAHPNNAEGSVNIAWSCEGAHADDMILCRTNAPLIQEAFSMITESIPVRMLGRNIGEGLIGLVQMLKPDSVRDLQVKLIEYKLKEIQKLASKEHRSQAAIIAIEDKCACLNIFCRRIDSIDGIIKEIKELFSQKAAAIILSSIHQAKGLEARNVFILRPDLLPHPLAKSPWQLKQEKNLEYVAITRAIDNLTWVEE